MAANHTYNKKTPVNHIIHQLKCAPEVFSERKKINIQ
jgi:hypothetical protein